MWSDGTPITYKDFAGLWTAQNGINKAFKPASTNGYEQIGSVDKGATDQDVTVVFKTPVPGLEVAVQPDHAGQPGRHPDRRSTPPGRTSPTVSGGPFMISSMDKTAKTITLTHNPSGGVRHRKLDKIQYIAIDQSAQAKALQSSQIDLVDIGSDVATYATVKATPGVYHPQGRWPELAPHRPGQQRRDV